MGRQVLDNMRKGEIRASERFTSAMVPMLSTEEAMSNDCEGEFSRQLEIL
jgi:hypothetical protein